MVLTDEVKAAVLTGSLTAAGCATTLLKMRNATYRALCAEEERDEDLDGIPDVYEQDEPATTCAWPRSWSARPPSTAGSPH